MAESNEKKQKKHSFLVPAAGLLSGISQVMAEQPLDMLKTRLQSSRFTQATGAVSLALATIRQEGARAMLLGITPRLLTYPLVKLSLFSLYEHFYARFQSTAAAGACAGALNAAISCPADVIKSQLQVTTLKSTGRPQSGASLARAAIELVRSQGPLVLYRGIAPLVVRDAIGYSILYTVYFRGQEWRRQNELAMAAPGWLLGGLAGTCFYGATLPIDRIKVMMQTQPGGVSRSLAECAADVMRGKALSAFYRGAGPTFARTFVGQAVALTVYDLATRS